MKRRTLALTLLGIPLCLGAHALSQDTLGVAMVAPANLEVQLAEKRAELETERAEKLSVEQALLNLPERERALENGLTRDVRALYRLRRGGLLPMANGLDALMGHASRVAHFERMTRRTLAHLIESRKNSQRLAAEVASIEAKVAVTEQAVADLESQSAAQARENAALQVAEVPLPAMPAPANEPIYGLTIVGESGNSTAPRTRFASQRGELALPVSAAASIETANTLQGEPLALTFATKFGGSVRAVADGRVVLVEPRDGHGILVIVDHGDRYRTMYGGLDAAEVQSGDSISKSARIGTAGSAPVYFELRKGVRSQDARSWLGL